MRKARSFKFVAVISLVIGLMSSAAFSAPVGMGSAVPGKALYGDYWGKSQEVQGDVESVVFTQSKQTASGDPYHSYPYYLPENSRIVSYNIKSKKLKVLN